MRTADAETSGGLAVRREAGWREPPSPVRVLVACGWLDPGEADDPRLVVDTLARAHVVVRVTTPSGRAAIVKHATRASVAGGRDLRRELFVYRLARWLDGIGEVLPRALLIDERRGLLALEALSAGPRAAAWSEVVPLASPGTPAALARAMARWHRATARLALWPSLADGILDLPSALAAAQEGRSEGTRSVMQEIVEDAQLAAALTEARSLYRHDCLIHGDLRCDNWLLDRAAAPPALKVFDWEMSGTGDAAWDVASAFAEAIVARIRAGETMAHEADGWPRSVHDVVAEIVTAYADARGLLDLGDAATRERLVLFAAARLLHVACEWADASGERAEDASDGTHAALAPLASAARGLLRARSRAAALLAAWGGS